jgi:hypothetical protein
MWGDVSRLKAENPEDHNNFGKSVSIFQERKQNGKLSKLLVEIK